MKKIMFLILCLCLSSVYAYNLSESVDGMVQVYDINDTQFMVLDFNSYCKSVFISDNLNTKPLNEYENIIFENISDTISLYENKEIVTSYEEMIFYNTNKTVEMINETNNQTYYVNITFQTNETVERQNITYEKVFIDNCEQFDYNSYINRSIEQNYQPRSQSLEDATFNTVEAESIRTHEILYGSERWTDSLSNAQLSNTLNGFQVLPNGELNTTSLHNKFYTVDENGHAWEKAGVVRSFIIIVLQRVIDFITDHESRLSSLEQELCNMGKVEYC